MKLYNLVMKICLLLLFGGQINGQIDFKEEFNKMKIHCNPFTCKNVGHRIGTKPCSCKESCSMYDTCCSPYNAAKLKSPIKASCIKEKSSNPSDSRSFYFMVDGCPNDDNRRSVWKNLCNDDRLAKHDVMKLVPVTSLLTSITYKNYFCFRCHAVTEDFVYWNVKLKGMSSRRKGTLREMKYDRLTYDSQVRTWIVRYAGSHSLSPVNWKVDVPKEISSLVVKCIPDLISDCSHNWKDDLVSRKCGSYEYVTRVRKDLRTVKYRNPHCAICNFEHLNKSTCKELFEVGGYKDSVIDFDDLLKPFGAGNDRLGLTGHGRFGTSNFKKNLFSFTDVLDINFSDGDKVGKIMMSKCNENYLWDPFSGICRNLVCLLPGDVVKGGKCVPK